MATTVNAYSIAANSSATLTIQNTGTTVLTGARVADKVGFKLLPVQTGIAVAQDIYNILKRNPQLASLGVNNASSTAYFASAADLAEYIANGNAAARTRFLQVLKSTTHDLELAGSTVRFKVVDAVSDGVVGLLRDPSLLAKMYSDAAPELAAQVRILKHPATGVTFGAKGLMLCGALTEQFNSQAVATAEPIPEGFDGVLFRGEIKVLGLDAEIPSEFELVLDQELLLHADKPVTRKTRGITPSVAMLLPQQSRDLMSTKLCAALEALQFGALTTSKLEELTKTIGGLDQYERKLELIRATHGDYIPESEYGWAKRLLRVVVFKTFANGGSFKGGTAYSLIAAEGSIADNEVIVPKSFGVKRGSWISVGRHPMTFGIDMDHGAVNGFQSKKVVGHTDGNVIIVSAEALSRMDGDEDGDVLICDLNGEFDFCDSAPALTGPGMATKIKKPLKQVDDLFTGDVEMLRLMGSFAGSVGLVHNAGTTLLDIARNKGIEREFWSVFGNVLTAFLTASVYVQKHDAEVVVGDRKFSSKVKAVCPETGTEPLNAKNVQTVFDELAESIGISTDPSCRDYPSTSYSIAKKAERASLSVWNIDDVVEEVREYAGFGITGQYADICEALVAALARVDAAEFAEPVVPMNPVVDELANRCAHRLDEMYLQHLGRIAPREDGKIPLKHFHEAVYKTFKPVVDEVVSAARNADERPDWAAIEAALAEAYEALVARLGDKFSTRFMVIRAMLTYVSRRSSGIGHAVRILACDPFVKAALLQDGVALMDVVVPEEEEVEAAEVE